MTDPAVPPSAPDATAWSDRIADRFACELSPVLADWFDQEIWKRRGNFEYIEPVDPSVLLAPEPEPIWPGLMNANLIPLVTNGTGDWLCGRVGADNRVSDIVQWYHGGGDWIVWGNDLAEAIIFDAFQSRLPGPRRRHAIPADDFEATRSGNTKNQTASDPLVQWALTHLPKSVGELGNSQSEPAEVAAGLIDAGVAEVAVRCELIQDSLGLSAFSSFLTSAFDILIGDMDLDPNVVSQWSFDRDLIPDDKLEILQRFDGSRDSLLQDWDAAEKHAVAVTGLSPWCAWGWDIAGFAAERRGDQETARNRYLRGAECPIFSDQSVRLQTHWTIATAGKFSAARLAVSFPETVAASEYLKAVCDPNLNQRSDRVSSHWLELGDRAFRDERFEDAHRYFIAAGWDLGMRPITAYGELLEKISESAQLCGQAGRSRVARVHRDCLRDRYGA